MDRSRRRRSGRIARAASKGISVAVAPWLVGYAIDPYSRRGEVRTWMLGLGAIAGGVALAWIERNAQDEP